METYPRSCCLSLSPCCPLRPQYENVGLKCINQIYWYAPIFPHTQPFEQADFCWSSGEQIRRLLGWWHLAGKCDRQQLSQILANTLQSYWESMAKARCCFFPDVFVKMGADWEDLGSNQCKRIQSWSLLFSNYQLAPETDARSPPSPGIAGTEHSTIVCTRPEW